jgi:hypothetical protein
MLTNLRCICSQRIRDCRRDIGSRRGRRERRHSVRVPHGLLICPLLPAYILKNEKKNDENEKGRRKEKKVENEKVE